MGYTHYWKNTVKLPQGLWDQFIKDVKKVHKNLPEKTATAGGYHENDLLRLDGCSRFDKPQFNKDMVYFNGAGKGLGHETFYLYQKGSGSPGDFCKTARKPYDLMVTCVLTLYAHYFGAKTKVRSDGDQEDWQCAFDLLKELSLPVPKIHTWKEWNRDKTNQYDYWGFHKPRKVSA